MRTFFILVGLGLLGILSHALAQRDLNPQLLAPTHVRIPQQILDTPMPIITLSVTNIQVQAKWDVLTQHNSGLSLSIQNGILYLLEHNNQNNAQATIIVQDLFSALNPQYQNLAATATINLNFAQPADITPQMFISGGNSSSYFQEVWSSGNGENWTLDANNASAWAGREFHQMVSHNGHLYLMGGQDPANLATRYRDVWSSRNGNTWAKVGDAGWFNRTDFGAAVHQGKIFVAGGFVGSNRNDVWSSPDGENWSQVLGNGNGYWAKRSSHGLVSHNGLLYIIAGYGPFNDVWSSADGKEWTQEASGQWTARFLMEAVSHNGRLYVLGGADENSNLLGDVWSSAYGKNWTLETNNMGGGARAGFATFSYQGRLYIASENNVWSSVDGQNWEPESNIIDGRSIRRNIAYAVHPPEMFVNSPGIVYVEAQNTGNNNLYTFTAEYGAGGYVYSLAVKPQGINLVNGVLSTEAGLANQIYTLTVWATDREGNRAFTSFRLDIAPLDLMMADSPLLEMNINTRLNLHRFVATGSSFPKHYEFISGNENGYFALGNNDGMLSVGINNPPAGFYHLQIAAYDEATPPSRVTANAVVYVIGDQQIYLMGGFDGSNYFNDVWSSTDGKTWRNANESAPWDVRSAAAAAVFNDKMYVTGGVNSSITFDDVWSSRDGVSWAREANGAWPPRRSHTAIAHNGRLYIIAGNFGGTFRNDVWSTDNGTNWRLDNSSPFSTRIGIAGISFNGRMYVTGGRTSDARNNEVWSSTDGKTWELETDNPGWVGRYYHALIEHNETMYLMGGRNAVDTQYNDIWSSTDGKTWVSVGVAAWSGRDWFNAVSYQGSVYVMAGHHFNSDVWASADLQNWVSLTVGAWPGRDAAVALTYPPNILINGYGDRPLLTVGQNVDELHTFTAQYGVGDYTFSLDPAAPGFALNSQGVLSVDDAAIGHHRVRVKVADRDGSTNFTTADIYLTMFVNDAPRLETVSELQASLYSFSVIGGIGDLTYQINNQPPGFTIDQNGVLSVDHADVGAYDLAIVIADQNNNRVTAKATVQVTGFRFYLFGGYDGTKNFDDTWLSLQGGDWFLADPTAEWTPRRWHQMVSHNGKLFLIGGFDGTYRRDIWSRIATDNTWQLVADNAPWSARAFHQAVTHRQHIFVLGGVDDNAQNTNDVWRSTDGAAWDLVTMAGWSARQGHQALSHQGRMYVLGGQDDSVAYRDIWSSVDGQNWELVNRGEWSARFDHRVVSHLGRIYMLGGASFSGNLHNDVWSSGDGGASWTRHTNAAQWSARQGHQVVSYDGLLYVLGGQNSSGALDDIWSSADGQNWTKEVSGWSARSDHQALAYPRLVLSILPEIPVLVSTRYEELYTLIAQEGAGDYTYSLESTLGLFRLSGTDNILQLLGLEGITVVGNYGLTIVAEDGDGNRAQAAMQIAVVDNIAEYYATRGELILLDGINPGPFTVATEDLLASDYQIYQIPTQGGGGNVTFSLDDLAGGTPMVTAYFRIDSSGRFYARQGIAAGNYRVGIDVVGSNTLYELDINVVVKSTGKSLMYLFGGGRQNTDNYENMTRHNDGWVSSNGIKWVRLPNDAPWSGRAGMADAVHNGRMYIMGGNTAGGLENDVWSTVDGVSWSLHGNAGWSARWFHKAISHKGTLYVMGGTPKELNYPRDQADFRNDVWSSVDGNTWTKRSNAGWSTRSMMAITKHNGRVYIIGGYRENGAGSAGEIKVFADVWYTEDFNSWSLATGNPNYFREGMGMRAVSFNGQIILSGGTQSIVPTGDNRVYSSNDGVRWVAINRTAKWHARGGMVKYKGNVFLMGGGGLFVNSNQGDFAHRYLERFDGNRWWGEGNAQWSQRSGFALMVYPPESEFYISTQKEVSELIAGLPTPIVHIYRGQQGAGGYKYELVSPQGVGFSLAGGGILSNDGSTPVGNYQIQIEATDANNDTARLYSEVKVVAEIESPPPLTAPVNSLVHQFNTIGGKNYVYNFANGIKSHQNFTLDDNGWLSVGNAPRGLYTLVVVAVDSDYNVSLRATAEVDIIGSQIYLFGGFDGNYKNDIWRGSWNLVDDDAAWAKRRGHQIVRHNNQLYLLGGFGSDSYNDVWISANNGAQWAFRDAAEWAKRQDHQAVSFNGKIFVLGGIGDARYNDIWSSSNGANWQRDTAAAEWGKRNNHQVVEFNGQLYLLGGHGGGALVYRDVWRSSNGVHWSVVTDNASWGARYGHQAIVHRGKLFVLGGYNGINRYDDVWSTIDGENWTRDTDNPGWAARRFHAAVSQNGRLYILGGDAAGAVNDVWSSVDGRIWQQDAAAQGWSARWGHQVMLDARPLFLANAPAIGLSPGQEVALYTLVAQHGTAPYTYSLADNTAGFAIKNNILVALATVTPGNYAVQMVVRDIHGEETNAYMKVAVTAPLALPDADILAPVYIAQTVHQLGLSGGYGAVNYRILSGNNAGYFSVVGDYLVINHAAPNTYELAIEVTDSSPLANNKVTARITVRAMQAMYLLGGINNANQNVSDIWTSVDGANWQYNSNSTYSARNNHHVVVFKGKIYVVGSNQDTLRQVWLWDVGRWQQQSTAPWSARPDSALVHNNRFYIVDNAFVYSSDDGINWRQESSAPGIPNSSDAISFNGLIYVMGGTDPSDSSAYNNDIWASADGRLWTKQNNAPWSARADHAVIVNMNKIYVFGGAGTVSFDDTWSSVDGVTWNLVQASVGFLLPRKLGQVVSFNDQIYVMGGLEDSGGVLSRPNDVWSLADGGQWAVVTNTAAWSGRGNVGAVVYPPDLLLLGGETAIDADYRGPIYTLESLYGDGNYTYAFASQQPNGFEMSGNVIRANDNLTAGSYVLSVMVTDGRGKTAFSAVRVLVRLAGDKAVYIFGGSDGTSELRDMWSSVDLVDWQNISTLPWLGTADNKAVVFNDKIYVMGNDEIWSWDRGRINNPWQQVTDSLPWTATTVAFEFLAHNARLYAFAGSEVWSSLDGGEWQLDTSTSRITDDSVGLSFDSRIYMFGDTNKVWSSFDGKSWAVGEVNDVFPSGQQAISHNGTVYMVGGLISSASNLLGQWSSRAAPWFNNRIDSPVVLSYNDQIYVMGGAVGGTVTSGIWSSPDGVTWTLENDASWPARNRFAGVIYRPDLFLQGAGNIWVDTNDSRAIHTLAAQYGDGNYTYSFSSPAPSGFSMGGNGVILIANTAAEGRHELSVQVDDGSGGRAQAKIYVDVAHPLLMLGGIDDNGLRNDVWSSGDGVSWQLLTVSTAWNPRRWFSGLWHNGQMYVVGGQVSGSSSNYGNDVWSSSDGVTWNFLGNANWDERETTGAAVVNNGQIYVLGGYYYRRAAPDIYDYKQDLWSSINGSTWQYRGDVEWSANHGGGRRHTEAMAHDGVMYLSGGNRRFTVNFVPSTEYSNDVWSSVDGGAWTQNTAEWPARSGHQMVYHEGKFYVLGGGEGYPQYNDVWSSADGVSWSEVTGYGGAGWSPRLGHQVISYRGKMYLYGGQDSSGFRDDIWSSVDGAVWVEEDSADWSPRVWMEIIRTSPGD